MLSNAADNWLHELFTDKQVALFDGVTLSYELAATKPDRIMYESIANKLNVPLEECVFVDDIKSYCDGAEAVGISSMQYIDFTSFRRQLKTILLP